MKLVLAFCLCVCMLSACDYMWRKTIHGNGNVTTEERNISDASKIKSYGSFDIEISQGAPSVRIEADENLLSYILTINRNGWLEIRSKDNANLSSKNKIKMYVTTDHLQDVDLAGSGNVTGKSKFTGADHLSASIAGSGNISLEVNTPSVDAHIAGSGNITLAGETENSKIDIAGVGNYKAQDLKSENVNVHIAGSGNVHVYAERNLDVNIAGSGDVYYSGNAQVKKSIAGSGNIKQVSGE